MLKSFESILDEVLSSKLIKNVDRLTEEEYYMFPELDIEPYGYISIRPCELYIELDRDTDRDRN
jgi:hypothetical protein